MKTPITAKDVKKYRVHKKSTDKILEPLYSTTAVAKIFDVSPETLRNLFSSGQIGGHKIGNQIKFGLEDIEKYKKKTYIPPVAG